MFLDEVRKLIEEHDDDPEAHHDIQNTVASVDARLALLELLFNTQVTGNPFTVTFETLDGVNLEGVWNVKAKRVDF